MIFFIYRYTASPYATKTLHGGNLFVHTMLPGNQSTLFAKALKN